MNTCDDMCLGCDVCEPETPVQVGQVYKPLSTSEHRWTVIGFDSPTVVVMRGVQGQIRHEPTSGGLLLTQLLTLVRD